jgi:hypothetical protein
VGTIEKICLLKHTAAPAVPDSGSYEVRFPDGRPSICFYWDNKRGRASITPRMGSKEAEQKAKALARSEQDKLPETCNAGFGVRVALSVCGPSTNEHLGMRGERS